MDDLTKTQADLTAEMWQEIDRIERRLVTLRNALTHTGASETTTAVSALILEEALLLVQIAAKAEGVALGVRLM